MKKSILLIYFLSVILLQSCGDKKITTEQINSKLDKIEQRILEAKAPAEVIIIDSAGKRRIDVNYDSLFKALIGDFKVKAMKDTVLITKVKQLRYIDHRVDTLYREVRSDVRLMYDYNRKEFAFSVKDNKADSIYKDVKIITKTIEIKPSLWEQFKKSIIIFIIGGICTIVIYLNIKKR